MNTLFSPAIFLLNRLKYPQKFTLISLLFVLPLALVMFLLLSEIQERIEFAQNEMYGNAYLRPLRNLSEHVPQSRRLMLSYTGGETGLQDQLLTHHAKIDADFEALAEAEQRFGSRFGTTGRFITLRGNWNYLRDEIDSVDATSLDLRYMQMMGVMQDLMVHVGNKSNLVLDPALDTYYLMDGMLFILPEAQALTNKILTLNTELSQDGVVTLEERAQLRILISMLEANTKRTHRSFLTAFNNSADGNLQVVLKEPARHYQDAVAEMIRSFNGAVTRYDPAVLNRAGEKVLERNFALWDLTNAEMDTLLQARINEQAQKRFFISAFSVVVLLIVLYLLVGFYRSVMRTVRSLEHAAQSLVSGDAATQVRLDNRDELGQVAVSFNAVATALIDASAQRQAVVEHAIDGIVTLDASGTVTSFNPAAERIFGYCAADVIGRPVMLLVPEFNTFESDSVARVELSGQRKDGVEIPLELARSTMEMGAEQQTILVVRDITEHKQAEAQQARLQAAIIDAHAAALRELSSPLIPLTDDIVVLPLIGKMDSQRAEQMQVALLEGVETRRARVAILDISGVPTINSQVADGMLQAAQAVRLLGAEVIVTGMRPEIAQTLIGLGTDLRGLVTYATLQSGIEHAMARTDATLRVRRRI